MARKERNDIDYFPHSVAHGKKMFYIRSKYKNDGYAVWFMLLEELGKAEYHYLDLKDDIQLMYLSASLMVDELVLRDIINTLVNFGEFDKELWEENSVLFNEKFVENISDAYKKRNNDCINKKSLVELLITKGTLKPPKSTPKPPKGKSEGDGNTQSKVKESKEDYSKGKDSIGGEIISPTLIKKNINDRSNEFKNKIWAVVRLDPVKSKDLEELKRFHEYWEEHGDNDKKMRFEKEKSFSIKRRLDTWFNNKNKFDAKNSGNKQGSSNPSRTEQTGQWLLERMEKNNCPRKDL